MPESTRAIAERAYAALADRDLEGLLSCVHPDVEFTSLVAEAEGETYHGHSGVRDWWVQMTNALGGLDFRLTGLRELGDCAVSEVRVAGAVGGTEIVQVMWQAAEVGDGRVVWWGTFRTEEEARAAAEARCR